MTRITEAREVLEVAAADVAEVERLLTEQVSDLEAFRVSGSKDFDRRATMEGRHMALENMLGEQRRRVEGARAELTAAEHEAGREEALADLRTRAVALEARRREVDDLLSELGAFVVAHLGRITSARTAWAGELEDARQLAMSTFHLPRLENVRESGDRGRWQAALKELGDGDALLCSPLTRGGAGLSVAYTRPGALPDPHSELGIVEAARLSLLRYLDRPVTLTLAAAIVAADSATPEELKGRETT